MKRLLLVLAFALPLTAACSDDCEVLAEETCARLGESTKECEAIRKRAASASADDKRLCGQARALSQRLTPKS